MAEIQKEKCPGEPRGTRKQTLRKLAFQVPRFSEAVRRHIDDASRRQPSAKFEQALTVDCLI